MNFWEILILSFAFQSFVLAFLFFFKKSEIKSANTIWSIFLFSFALNITYNIIYWSEETKSLSDKLEYFFLIPFSLYGPLFYLYVRTLVSRTKFRYYDFFYFLPTLLVLIGFGNFYILPTASRVDIVNTNRLDEYILLSKWYYYWGLSITTIIYSVWTFRKFKKTFSNDKELSLWLKIITNLNLLFGASWGCFFILFKTNILQIEHDYFITLLMITFVGLTTYFGFNYPLIFNGKSITKVFPFIKYKNSGMSKRVVQDYRKKLLKLMDLNSPHLDSEITLNDLALKLNLSRHHTSQVINECFDMSFYDFINKYRIEEAEKMLLKEDLYNLNITDIAYKSGFNNRMSFYNAFKKYVGTTPSDYKKSNLAS